MFLCAVLNVVSVALGWAPSLGSPRSILSAFSVTASLYLKSSDRREGVGPELSQISDLLPSFLSVFIDDLFLCHPSIPSSGMYV